MTTILLAGATGLVGGIALTLMLDDDRVTQVVAPTRRPLARHSKLRNPLVDSGTLSRDAPWWEVDGAICALGTTRKKAGSAEAFRAVDHDYVLAIAAALRRGGARRFALTSSMGADSRSPLLYPRTKGEVEAAVRQLAFPSLTIVRPGLLGGERAEHRPMERIMGRMLRIAGPILPASARISPAATVAQLLIEAALAGQPGTHVITAADIARAAAL
ncbi:MAG: NAD-dependent dehydratase [Pseudomonadota bacterium]